MHFDRPAGRSAKVRGRAAVHEMHSIRTAPPLVQVSRIITFLPRFTIRNNLKLVVTIKQVGTDSKSVPLATGACMHLSARKRGPPFVCVGVPGVQGYSSPFPIDKPGRFSIKNYTSEGQLFTTEVCPSRFDTCRLVLISYDVRPFQVSIRIQRATIIVQLNEETECRMCYKLYNRTKFQVLVSLNIVRVCLSVCVPCALCQCTTRNSYFILL